MHVSFRLASVLEETYPFYPKACVTGILGIDDLKFIPPEWPRIAELCASRPVGNKTWIPSQLACSVRCHDVCHIGNQFILVIPFLEPFQSPLEGIQALDDRPTQSSRLQRHHCTNHLVKPCDEQGSWKYSHATFLLLQ